MAERRVPVKIAPMTPEQIEEWRVAMRRGSELAAKFARENRRPWYKRRLRWV